MILLELIHNFYSLLSIENIEIRSKLAPSNFDFLTPLENILLSKNAPKVMLFRLDCSNNNKRSSQVLSEELQIAV